MKQLIDPAAQQNKITQLTDRCHQRKQLIGQKRRGRSGVAVTELAVCLPILVILTLGAIETCSMIYLKQSLKIAAYEGARVALIPGTNNSNVIAQCNQILDDRDIANGVVQVSPSVAASSPGTILKVTVDAPCNGNGPIASIFFRGQTMSASVEMMKEL